MASKTLIRTGSSLINRFLSNPILHQKTTSNSPVVSHGLDITPKLFPSLSNFQSPLHLHQNNAESMKKVANEGFVYPCGLPSLRFFLPDGRYLLHPLFGSRENVRENICLMQFYFFILNYQLQTSEIDIIRFANFSVSLPLILGFVDFELAKLWIVIWQDQFYCGNANPCSVFRWFIVQECVFLYFLSIISINFKNLTYCIQE